MERVSVYVYAMAALCPGDTERPPADEAPADPDELFCDPDAHGLEPCARGWGVFEFTELRGVYASRELAEEIVAAYRTRWLARRHRR